jgi:hypothetical protein
MLVKRRKESGFAEIIVLLGLAVLFGTGFFIISKSNLPPLTTGPQPFSDYSTYYNAPSEDQPFPQNEIPPLTPTIVTSRETLPSIAPIKLEPLTITLTDTQFTQFVNTYKPDNLPVSDIIFTFSDNTIEAETNAASEVIQGTIRVIAVHENNWFRITHVYLGTYELPPTLTAEIDAKVQESLNNVLASLYLDGLQIESIKGHTIRLTLNAPKGYLEKNSSGVNLNNERYSNFLGI